MINNLYGSNWGVVNIRFFLSTLLIITGLFTAAVAQELTEQELLANLNNPETNNEATWALSTLYAGQGKFEEALKYFKMVETEYFHHDGIYFVRMAKTFETSLTPPQVLAIIEHAYKIAPEVAYVLVVYIDHVKHSDLEKALELMQVYYTLDIVYDYDYENIAIHLISRGMEDEALVFLDAGRAKFPESDRFWVHYANTYAEKKQYEKAEEYYKKAKKEESGEQYNYYSYILFLNETKQYQKLVDEAIKFIHWEHDPDAKMRYKIDRLPALSSYLAEAYREENTEQFYLDAIEFYPEISQIKLHYARYLNNLYRNTEAETYARMAQEQRPDVLMYNHFLAQLLELNGKLEEAEIYYKIWEELRPKN